MLRLHRSLPLLCFLVTSPAAAGEPHPLFAEQGVLEVTIDAPISTLMDVRPDVAWLKGSFTYREIDGSERRIGLKLQTRGNYRRDKSHCDFAPIRLDFKKDDVRGTLLHGQNKLKLVTHCRSYEQGFEEIALREHLAYRLFNALSPVSFESRIVRVTYFDTESEKELVRYGFVIEDDKDMAKRNDLKLAKERFLQHEEHDRARQNLVHVFEYMIGNTEYSLVDPEPGKNCCHNAELLSPTKEPPFVAVPFDFDFSGLVDAPYAEPNPKYPIQTVRKRFYKGLCENNHLLPATLQAFQDARNEMFARIAEVEAIDGKGSRAAKSVGSYVERFFKLIGDPDKVAEDLIGKCRVPGPREIPPEA